MSVELLRAIRSRWHAMVEYLWPATPEERQRAECDRLAQELNARFRRLVGHSGRIEQIRLRLARQESLLQHTPQDPDLSAAVERNRRRVASMEAKYQRQRQVFEQRKRLLAEMSHGSVVALPPG